MRLGRAFRMSLILVVLASAWVPSSAQDDPAEGEEAAEVEEMQFEEGSEAESAASESAAEDAPSQDPTAPTAPLPPLRLRLPEVVLSDNFDDPGQGVLPRSGAEAAGVDPAPFIAAYVEGEYQLRSTAGPDVKPAVNIPGAYADSAIAVDARVLGDAAGRFIELGCRYRVNPETQAVSGAFFVVYPSATRFEIVVLREGARTAAQAGLALLSLRPGNASNHLELTCFGNITGSINGVRVGVVQDAAGQEGTHRLAAGKTIPAGDLEVRFDNLVIRQL